MILITGKAGNGKKQLAISKYGSKQDFSNVFFLTSYIMREFDIDKLDKIKESALRIAKNHEIVIACELGACISSIDFKERILVEINGEIAQSVANIASEVFLVENFQGVKIK